jgi:hypothetical protein
MEGSKERIGSNKTIHDVDGSSGSGGGGICGVGGGDRDNNNKQQQRVRRHESKSISSDIFIGKVDVFLKLGSAIKKTISLRRYLSICFVCGGMMACVL